jgi:hypothetical protein
MNSLWSTKAIQQLVSQNVDARVENLKKSPSCRTPQLGDLKLATLIENQSEGTIIRSNRTNSMRMKRLMKSHRIDYITGITILIETNKR